MLLRNVSNFSSKSLGLGLQTCYSHNESVRLEDLVNSTDSSELSEY